MTSTPETVARAFSSHRFAEAYPYLAEDVRWVLVVSGGLIHEITSYTTELTDPVTSGSAGRWPFTDLASGGCS